jgi:division protein CdvB (Snf7/Vps24/ESCRT-III family)
VTTTNQSSETPVNIGITANPEAEKILEEAEFAVESRLREQLPEVAAGVTLSKKTELEA